MTRDEAETLMPRVRAALAEIGYGAATLDVVSVVGPNVTTTTYWGFSAGTIPATEVITWLP